MKKIIISLMFTGSIFSYAQVVTNQNITLNSESNTFLDASQNAVNLSTGQDKNIGRGLGFPAADLRDFELDIASAGDSYYNGMLIYNIADNGSTGDSRIIPTDDLKPGFYYFSNPEGNSENKLSKGKWVRIMDASELSAGVNSGKFWSLSGNDNVEPDSYLGTTKAQNVVMKVNVDKEGLQEAVTNDKIKQQDMDNYNPTKLILGNAKDAPAFTKVVIGGTPDEQKTALETRIKKVQPAGQADATDFKFVLEVFGKARFSEGIVTKASTYPDYVFDNYFTGKSDVNPDYKFKKLNEVEAFIKENNHLPGVTKIDDLAKTESGYEVDNTQLSIQTLEKVEELYLHLIEQQKEIQALKAQIAELKK